MVWNANLDGLGARDADETVEQTEFYVVADYYLGCHRTSNAVDRPMNRLCRLMHASRSLHGHQSSSELRLRGRASPLNFPPMRRGATNPAPLTVPPIDSTAHATMNIGSTT